MDLSLQGKRVLVTGSGAGIGKATARTFVEEGASVIVNGLTEDEVSACVDDLGALGDVSGLAADLTRTEDAEVLCDFAVRSWSGRRPGR